MNNKNILSDELREEIKNLIHEVLDERGYRFEAQNVVKVRFYQDRVI